MNERRNYQISGGRSFLFHNASAVPSSAYSLSEQRMKDSLAWNTYLSPILFSLLHPLA